jgi:hypothetical protein
MLQKQAMTRREERSFKSNPILKVALRRTLQIGHRSGNALKKNRWAILSHPHSPLESRLSLEQ